MSLKGVCVDPNLKFIPDNEFNRKAGTRYLLEKGQYRGYILENMPISF
jgi:hypothetical protein